MASRNINLLKEMKFSSGFNKIKKVNAVVNFEVPNKRLDKLKC